MVGRRSKVRNILRSITIVLGPEVESLRRFEGTSTIVYFTPLVTTARFAMDPFVLTVITIIIAVLTLVFTIGQYRESLLVRRISAPDRSKGLSAPTDVEVPLHPRKITTEELLALQRPDLLKVWVYAPQPLETLPGRTHVALRKRVFDNLRAGVEYVYFVDSADGIWLIHTLLERMNVEGAGGESTLEQIKSRTVVVVLPADDFLTHYTAHFKRNGEFTVYQSVVDPGRNDTMEEVPDVAAEKFRHVMDRKIKARKPETVEGIRVHRTRRTKK